MTDTLLKVGNYQFSSRLMVGTGKYKSLEQTLKAVRASGANVVTFALRRMNITAANDEPNLLDYISMDEFTLLPNTAGCYNAKDAITTCKLARDLLAGHNLVKLEVLGDKKTLMPNVLETITACEELVKDDFQVMVYTNDDPILAKHFENLGAVAVMPLAAPIGSGLGIQNKYNIQIILENAKVPIIVDAGVGTASDASIAMELGCDGVLMNTAIAEAKNPILMAEAMNYAIKAGRLAYKAGRMPKRLYASASSPIEGHFVA